jgi:hypothetical protein
VLSTRWARRCTAAAGRFGIPITNGAASAIAISRYIAATASSLARSRSSRARLARAAKSIATARWSARPSWSLPEPQAYLGAAGFLVLSQALEGPDR